MKTRGVWPRSSEVISATMVVCALVFLVTLKYLEGAAAKTSQREFVSARSASGPVAPRDRSRKLPPYGSLPLTFEENVGQTAREVRFLSRGSGYELFLTPQEAVLALPDAVPRDLSPRHRFNTLLALRKARLAYQNRQLTAVRLRFDGANPEPPITGIDKAPGRVNYFLGNDPKKWHTDMTAYKQVKYTGIYPGVDLLFYGNQRHLEYDFVVAPGADPQAIRFHVEGAKKLQLDGNGNLELSAGKGKIEFQKPVIYQRWNGEQREIAGGYIVTGNQQIAFVLGEYDHTKPLILDPVLNYSTYLGGSSDDDAASIAVDASGNAIIAGTTFSTDFPSPASVNGFQKQPVPANINGASAAYVSKLDPTGTQLLYSTYLAGSVPFEFAFGVDVDSTGMIYVTGTTVSKDFPTGSVVAGFKPTSPANVNGTTFLTKLDPTATGAGSLVYSSYLGGTNGTQAIGDIGNSVAADPQHPGVVYVTGYTDSTAGLVTDTASFPVVGGFQATLGSPAGNAFLSKIDTTIAGTGSLLYSTYLGGNALNFKGASPVADFGGGVTADASGNAYVTGVTFSTNLATTANAVQLAYPSGNSTNTAFVARVDSTVTGAASLAYLSYLGGTGPDFGDAIALGPGNIAYVTGKTDSLNFPATAGAFSTTGNAAGPAFVTLVDTRAALPAPPVYSTFLGGSGSDNGFGIRVDTGSNVYVAGGASSLDFPVTPGAFQTTMPAGAAGNGFVSKLHPGGNGSNDLLYSTFFGGNGSGANIDQIAGIALDSSNNVYLAGQTFSSATFRIFPSPGALQGNLNGPSDAFIAKLTLIPTLAFTPSSLDFGMQPVGVTTPSQTVTLSNNTSDPIPFATSNLAFSGNNPADFASPSNTCGPSIGAGASCSVSVTFTPSMASAESATLVITVMITDGGISNSQSFHLPLTGTGGSAPGVGLSPASLTFGGQMENTTSAVESVTLTNTGTSALTINSVGTSGDFAETNNCPLSPATLGAQGTCTINVTFSPSAVGPRAGAVTIIDNASGSPHTVPLSGTGWDFLLIAPSSVSIRGRKSVDFQVSMKPLGGFHQTVELACSVELRKKSTCTVAPPSVTASDGVTPQTAVVTMMTKGLIVPPTSEPTRPLSTRQIVPLLLAFMSLLLLFGVSHHRFRLGMATAILLLVALAGCGYIAAPNTATGLNGVSEGQSNSKGTVTVTGTFGGVTKTVKVTLTMK